MNKNPFDVLGRIYRVSVAGSSLYLYMYQAVMKMSLKLEIIVFKHYGMFHVYPYVLVILGSKTFNKMNTVTEITAACSNGNMTLSCGILFSVIELI